MTPEEKLKQSNQYTGKQIVVLEGLAPVRKRPAMYIGSTDITGLHHCLTEIIDNSIDEALAGFAKNVWVIINKDGSALVADDGRGIPVDIIPQYKKSALEIVLTKLHAGGKFEGTAYKISGGLHGVGASAVNAISLWMKVEVRRSEKFYYQEYERGVPKTDLKTNKKTVFPITETIFPSYTTGTTTSFTPDPIIFKETIQFGSKRIRELLHQRAFLIPKIFFHFIDERTDHRHDFYFEDGLLYLIKSLNKKKRPIHVPISIKGTEEDKEVEIVFQYNETSKEELFSFVNVINTQEGGTHTAGFKTGISRSIKDYIVKNNLSKDGDDDLTGDDMREGLTAIISLRMPSKDLQFEGQTKMKLGNSEIQPLVNRITKEQLDIYFEEHPQEARLIVSRVLLAMKARKAARAAKDAVLRKGAFDSLGLPGKLADCQSKKPEECELYIVEGPSAGGSAKQGRDRKFQAILPLGGKILNTERARLDKIVEFEELKDLIIALGMGIGETIDPEKTRYHRIIIMTDADVDGSHIATLLLTFFYRHLPQVIEKGYLYIAQPPLYKITFNKKTNYAYSDEEKETVLGQLGDDKNQATLQRYKGLGEMNPEQLWETTMNPENRILKKVTVGDAQKADETFTILMGDEVPPRKHFIQTHAKLANLDI